MQEYPLLCYCGQTEFLILQFSMWSSRLKVLKAVSLHLLYMYTYLICPSACTMRCYRKLKLVVQCEMSSLMESNAMNIQNARYPIYPLLMWSSSWPAARTSAVISSNYSHIYVTHMYMGDIWMFSIFYSPEF